MNNILLFDEYAIVRKGISVLLGEHFPSASIDESASEQETVSLVSQKQYRIILLEFKTATTEFSKLISWIRDASPETYILVFSRYPEDLYGLLCIQTGAHGFLSKSAEYDEILRAFNKAWNRENYISVKLSELLTSNFTKRIPKENPLLALSQRETEIAIQIEKGDSLTEISQRLQISYSTVNTYKRRIFEKLNVKNVLQLARLIQALQYQFGSSQEAVAIEKNSNAQENPPWKDIQRFRRA